MSRSTSPLRGLLARLCGVAPELAGPVGPLEVGEHEHVEKLGANRACIQAAAAPPVTCGMISVW